MGTRSDELSNDRYTGGLAGRRRRRGFGIVCSIDRTAGLLLAGWLAAAGTVLFALGSLIIGNVTTSGELIVLIVPAMLLIACLEIVRCGLARHHNRLPRETTQSHGDAVSDQDNSPEQNRIISEVCECGELNSALTALFRNLIPQASGGFAACFEFRRGRTVLSVVRGVSKASRPGLVLDESLSNRLRQTDFAHVTTEELRRTKFVSSLVSSDRRKIRELYLFRIGDSRNSEGIIISTRLFPRIGFSGKPDEVMDRDSSRQILRETAEHLLDLMRRDAVKLDEQSLSVFQTADHETVPVNAGSADTDSVASVGTSIAACEFLLKTLRDTISVDRASVCFPDDSAGRGPFDSRVVCSSVTVPPGFERIWRAHEATLAEHANDQAFVHFPQKALHRLGVETVISVAVVAGFPTASGRPASLVVSHRGRWQPSARDERLIAGCCECVCELLNAAEANAESADRTTLEKTATPAPTTVKADSEQNDDSLSKREEFLAVMSHELRSPMSAILGMTELALSQESAPEQRQYLSLVQSSSESMLTMLNDVLDLAKLEAGQLEPEQIEFDPRAVLGDALKSIAFKVHEKNLELCLGIGKDVPDRLVGDPARLRQVIINLVSNAAKFTEEGEIAVRVDQERSEERRCGLRFAVRDTGCGIPYEAQARIFSKYAQVDASVSRKHGGTGLGLAISQEIVELMGGAIAVHSEPGNGSTFQFTLEFGIPESSATCDAAGNDSDWSVTGPVLIADDHPDTCADLAEIVESLNLDCYPTGNAEDAFSHLQRAWADPLLRPATLLLDVDLPSAGDVVREIRSSPVEHRPSVILLRSMVPPRDNVDFDEEFITGSLLKPVYRGELLTALKQANRDRESTGPNDGHPVESLEIPSLFDRSLRVLLAEDMAVNQCLAVHLLQHAGMVVTVVENGREAVEVVQRKPFDLVLMDLMMPELDGVSATGEIRRHESLHGIPRIPIVAMTAHRRAEDRVRCQNAGMDGFLSKPLSLDELKCCLQELETQGILETADFTGVEQADSEESLLDEVAQLFRDTCPDSLAAIKQAVTDNDAAALAGSAHGLKGAACCVGADRLEELLYELERMGEENRLNQAPPHVVLVEAEISRLLR